MLLSIALCLSSLALAEPLSAQQYSSSTTTAAAPEPEHAVSMDAMGPSGQPIRKERQTPEYGGAPSTTAGDVLIWVPRVMLFPVFVVHNYVVRLPLQVATRTVEKYNLDAWALELTTWGDVDDDGPDGGIRPLIQADLDFSPTVGLLFYYDDLPIPSYKLEVAGRTDFNHNHVGKLVLKQRPFSGALRVEEHFHIKRRNDRLFFGVGPTTPTDEETRYSRDSYGAGAEALLLPVLLNTAVRLNADVERIEYGCADTRENDICGPDHIPESGDDRPAIDQASGASQFGDGYTIARLNARLAWDSRAERPESGTGLRVAAFGGYGNGLGASNESVRFARYGGEVAGFLDLLRQRTIGLRLYAELAEPVGGTTIPFEELITLGGIELMRGFAPGRIRGRSAAVATLEYRYPVWSFFDGFVFAEAGNVFGEGFEQFELGAARGAFGFGVRTIKSRHVALNALAGFGTTRFDDDSFGVDSVRLMAGTNWGF